MSQGLTDRIPRTTPGLLVHTLEDCTELRELVLILFFPTPQAISLITSITSKNIQKIVFEPYISWDKWEYKRWSPLDTALSGLVDRLRASEYDHTLELEFRPKLKVANMDSGVDPDALFPNFREKGRVSIVEHGLLPDK